MNSKRHLDTTVKDSLCDEKIKKKLYRVYRLHVLGEFILGMITFMLTVRTLYYCTIINDFLQRYSDGSRDTFMVAWPDYEDKILILYIVIIIAFPLADFSRRKIKRRLSVL